MRRIPVFLASAEGGVCFAAVDDQDFERLAGYRWSLNREGGYPQARVRGQVVSMHRVILPDAGEDVDHRDRDPLNNQRANLRACTHSENMFNRPRQRNGSSRFKGVYRFRRGWAAKIEVRGLQLHLGTFADEEAAARAYDAAAREHAGEYAHVNFPDEPPRVDSARSVGVRS